MIKRSLIGTDLVLFQQKGASFNLDTVLISDFVKLGKTDLKVIDCGTGNGAIALYLSQKSSKAKIIGVEIQEQRAKLALDNVKLNNLEDRIQIVNCDYKDYKDFHVDAIVCNPPFFKVNDQTKVSFSEDELIARHEIHLKLEELIKKSSELLKNKGKFYLIHRPDRLIEILEIFNKNDLIVKEIRFVHPYLNKEANHVLIKAVKKANHGCKVLDPLIIYKEKHILTDEIKRIYNEEL